MKHELPALPFSSDALQPYISAETIEYHYGKHHKAYVDKLNSLIPGTEYENSSLEEIIRRAKGPLFNNAAQAWNHTFFWNCLKPQGGTTFPVGTLAEAINRSFGGFETFCEAFEKAAIDQFGSGWAWLVRNTDGELAIEASSNAENPLRQGHTPLLTVDVWEHAYYIDYRNERPKFVKAIWNVANWAFVQRNFDSWRKQKAA